MMPMSNSLEGNTKEERFYGQMSLVRAFEERVFELFSAGDLFGTTHGYIGQEANAVALLTHLTDQDIVVSNHRCHGHYLVRTGDVEGLLAELMGRAGGVTGGRGGSQHVHRDNFFSSGILGSTAPVAAGMALAEKIKGSGAITVLLVGDGTFGEGVVYETLNMAALWGLPLLVVVENNRYAQTTPIALNFSGSFVERARAFGLTADEIESNDCNELDEKFAPVVQELRNGGGPHMQVLNTYRLNAHSKGDDFRPSAEIAAWRANDPLDIAGARLDPHRRQELDAIAAERVRVAETTVRGMDFPSPELAPRVGRGDV
jgi:TPP-dependent pyruvate/acetoin dehydrogenase alpha subunit